MNMDNVACFRCGQVGHLRAACPQGKPLPAAVPAPDAPAPLDRLPGYGVPIPPRRPEEEIADSRMWAGIIRDQQGWHSSDDEERKRELARRQVTESRRARMADVFR